MNKIERYMWFASYVLLIIVVLWVSLFFITRSDKAQEQRCSTTLLGIEIQTGLADYTIDVLGGDKDPTDDAENASRRAQIDQARSRIAELCNVPLDQIPAPSEVTTAP